MNATLKLLSAEAIKSYVSIMAFTATDLTSFRENLLYGNHVDASPGFGHYFYRAALGREVKLRYSLSGMEKDPMTPDPLSEISPPLQQDGAEAWTTIPPYSAAFGETYETFHFSTPMKIVGTTPRWLWDAGLSVSIPPLHTTFEGIAPGPIPIRVLNHNPYPVRLYLLDKGIVDLAFYVEERF